MAMGTAASVDSIGTAIRQLRRAKGLTLERLAQRVGCVKGYLSAIESGKRPPPEAALAERLEQELSAPAGFIVRASAWSRTPKPVKEAIRAIHESYQERAGDVPRVNSIAGWRDAERVVVVRSNEGPPHVCEGDVAVLGAEMGLGGARAGSLVAVEHSGGTSVLQWPPWYGVIDRDSVVSIRPVLGVCRVFEKPENRTISESR